MRGGFGNMAQMMQQASQMKKKMEAVQAELAKKTMETSAGGGAVKAVVNGKRKIIDLVIAPEALEGADAEMLQDMVKAAVSEALKKSKKCQLPAMGGIMGNLPIPPGLL